MTRELKFDPSREPLPPAEELWGPDGMPAADQASDVHDDIDAGEKGGVNSDALGDDRLRELVADSLGTPMRVPRDAMWAAITARRASNVTPVAPAVQVHRLTPRTARRIWPQLAALAATLVVGVAIGRTFDPRTRDDAAPSASTPTTASTDGTAAAHAALPLMLAQLTAEHLGRTEALLVTAKQDLSGSSIAPNGMVADWARDLLSTTRLLLDTNELTEPRTRRLLQDLELTLALIVQAQSSGRSADVQAAREELSTGDLLLRVRGAATPTMPTMLSTDDVRGMSE